MRWSLVLCLLLLGVCVVGVTAACGAAPEILEVVIDRGNDVRAPDKHCAHQRVKVQVSDADGAADIASVTVVYPNGDAVCAAPGTLFSEWVGKWEVVDETTVNVVVLWGPAWEQAGTYGVTVRDASDLADTLTTAAMPGVSDYPRPALVAPVMESVISESTPTFAWTDAGSPTRCVLRVEEEGTAGVTWSKDVGAATSVTYNSDGTATQPELQPNHTYNWQIETWHAIDNRVSDPRVELWGMQQTGGRFAVYGAWEGTPPALPGKLVYGSYSWPYWGPTSFANDVLDAGTGWLMQYNPDPSERSWVGPDVAAFADWSPDGTKLLYSTCGQMVIDALDGSAPTPIALPLASYGDIRWASDSQRIVFSRFDSWKPWPNSVWVANVDGTNLRLLVEAEDADCRYPDWSPDGLWVSYRRIPHPEDQGLWMVRYDGAENHPLVASGVVGHPDWMVVWMGDSMWSPDGNSLVFGFSAVDEAEEGHSGVGIMSRDGGPIRPVWMDPPNVAPGVACCAASLNPNWSPDGTQVIFSSGHHLADPAPPGVFEPRAELWLMNADGSGEPVRLTYDQSFNNYTTWWAPNTEAGTDVAVTRGYTTVDFDQVDSTGHTSVTVYEQPVEFPTNFEFCKDGYQIHTTADFSGVIHLEMRYRDQDIPSGVAEAELSIYHFDSELGEWVDITTSRDPENNVVTGECTSLSVFGITARLRFSDVGFKYWAYRDVEACVKGGIVGGYPDGTYRPEVVVTRDQMAAFISRALAGGDSGVPSGPPVAHFPDVDMGYWAYKYVEYAYANSIVGGYPEGNYRPLVEVDRGQMAAFIARAIVTPHGEAGLATYIPPGTPSFPDVAADFWTYKHIEYLKEHLIVGGYPDGWYHPEVVCTRDQMAVYITRAFGLEP